MRSVNDAKFVITLHVPRFFFPPCCLCFLAVNQNKEEKGKYNSNYHKTHLWDSAEENNLWKFAEVEL